MFGDQLGSSYRDIESHNLESSNKSINTECLLMPQQKIIENWRVLHGNLVATDNSLDIECI